MSSKFLLVQKQFRAFAATALVPSTLFFLSTGANAWAAAPSPVSVTPSSGSGFTQTFSFTYSHPSGYANIQWVQMLFNTSISGANACYLHYYRPDAIIHLANDAGTSWTYQTIGTAGTLQNSQCSLNVGASSFSASGNNLTVNLALTFKAPFAGTKNIYTQAMSTSGEGSGWHQMGTWTVPQALTPVSVTPSSGTGLTQTFSFLYSDINGYSDIQWVQMLFNTGISGVNACYLHFYRPGSIIELADNAGTNWTYQTIGTAGTLSNSQCSLNVGASSAYASGNNLTVTLALTFSTGFAGTKNVYMRGAVVSGYQTSWEQKGTWTVPAAGGPTITTSSPLPNGTVGVFYSQTFTATGGTPPYTWSVISGSLPPGLSLSSGGVLSGTPTTASTYNFTVQVSGGGTSSKAFSLTIGAALSITTSSPLPNGTVGVFYSQTLTATGGTPPYTWSLASGELPYSSTPAVTHKFVLSSDGVLSGTPAIYNSYSLNVQVRDSANQTATKVLSLTIPSGPGVWPAQTEINLAAVPIDLYRSAHNGKIVNCDAGWTVKQCLAKFFRDDPDNFVKQGITGVRFFFPLGSANDSTPFHSDGTVDVQDWVPKLSEFFSDLRSYGIQRITPTPVLTGNWSGTLDANCTCDGTLSGTVPRSTTRIQLD